MAEMHSAAQQGFSVQADRYSRGRPGYPDALLGWLRGTMQLGPGVQVIDLGAGTGKFTHLLLKSAASVTAVEPVDAMRRQLQLALPGVPAVAGTAQALPFEDGQADAIVCAQAFHWFATPLALGEMHRVLAPGGRLGLVWNVRDESIDWLAALTQIMHPYEAGVPRYRSGEWRRLFPNALFSDLQETSFEYRHIGSPQAVIVDRVMSVSFIAALPASERAQVGAQLASLIEGHAQLRGRAVIEVPYLTHAYCCVRAGSMSSAR